MGNLDLLSVSCQTRNAFPTLSSRSSALPPVPPEQYTPPSKPGHPFRLHDSALRMIRDALQWGR